MHATIQYIKKELDRLYPKSEIDSFSRLIFEAVCGLNFTEQILQKNIKINSGNFRQIEDIVFRLKNFEPIQYILGETEFYDLKLKVNPSVLIPRPETEELVHWITETKHNNLHNILDIGTGSGCIALALKNRLKNTGVAGIDISENALQVARENAIQNKLEVEFFKADILNWENCKWKLFDVIVSNPPYIRESEKKKMNANVLNYEPENALFVSDKEPLVFYRKIAEFAKKYLEKNGWLYFEINEKLNEEMKKMLNNLEFVNIEIKKDLNRKDRMLRCTMN